MKLSKLFTMAALIITSMLSQCSSIGLAEGLVCPKFYIEGHEEDLLRGAIVGPPTKEISRMKIFIHYSPNHDCLYVQSNFVPSNSSHATKLIIENPSTAEHNLSALKLVEALTYKKNDGPELKEALHRIEFIYDPSAISQKAYPQLTLGKLDNSFVAADSGTLQSVRHIPGRAPAVKVAPGVYIAAESTSSGQIRTLLAKNFNSNDVRVVCGVQDLNTETLFKQLPTTCQVKPKNFSTGALRELFSSHKNKLLFFLGHVENGCFISEELGLNVAISTLEQFARDSNVSLFALGCDTAQLGSSGTLRDFQTDKVMGDLVQAIKTAKTYRDFYGTVASDDLDFVIDYEVFLPAEQRLRLTLIRRKNGAILGTAIAAVAIPSGVSPLNDYSYSKRPIGPGEIVTRDMLYAAAADETQQKTALKISEAIGLVCAHDVGKDKCLTSEDIKNRESFKKDKDDWLYPVIFHQKNYICRFLGTVAYKGTDYYIGAGINRTVLLVSKENMAKYPRPTVEDVQLIKDILSVVFAKPATTGKGSK